mmetsp:Transcript_8894/g.11131  ORF Transcript_8894/g.11131 Transcript_8894/m.11131 type:complete len:159 (+) Transcript_8894:67-543(+)
MRCLGDVNWFLNLFCLANLVPDCALRGNSLVVAPFRTKPICHSVRTISILFSVSPSEQDKIGADTEKDTIRVRIWQALASGDEMDMKQLGSAVGERNIGELKSHLTHVEKQAKTLSNKSKDWRERRGLSVGSQAMKNSKKVRLRKRRGNGNKFYVSIR